MSIPFVCGIDPGASGGIAVLDAHGHWEVYPMPETDSDVADLFRPIAWPECVFFIEKVHSMPAQGVASSFTFGKNYGVLLGCLRALRCRTEHVQPKEWQQLVGLRYPVDTPYSERKKLGRARAQELFPHIKVTHAIADALMIAEYGRRVLTARHSP